MSLSTAELDNQKKLKQELQNAQEASKLECLAAALIGRLLDVPIAVAKSGFQHGADAGPAGQQGRRFRLECKKYSDNSSLSERELLGEIDQALARDEALEAWVLVATCRVSEQIRQSLDQHGERLGVPIVIIDWVDGELAPLAALCAFAPDLVEREFSREAGAAARSLQTISKEAIERLRRDLQYWCLGFEAIRTRSHDKLDKIWNSPQESKAALGQNVAGGAQQEKVKRSAVHKTLNAWWQGTVQDDAPAAVVGLEGAGKTWATLHWLIDSKDTQPIVLIMPSSAVAAIGNVSETTVKQLLSDSLHEMSGIRDREHWLRRLDRLLERPTDEGLVLTVFFDGLNQEPSVQWLRLLQVLQGETFAERVRVIVSTRNHHFEEKLSGLRGLAVPAERVDVDLYNTASGSELDQMLEFENLTQADLHPDVIELARNPRLFKLVVHFRERLVEAGQITVHRLLWEYGRDAFGERAGKSFSEGEWKDWLKEIAQQRRNGIKEYSVRSLGETVDRSDFTESEVYVRLSDIIDGRFTTSSESGTLQLIPSVVAHALGAALLDHLSQVASPTFETLDAKLTGWLDPISGFDEQAEILRAAVSIFVAQGRATDSPVSGVLVTAWLQSQNIPDEHRRDLVSLAPNLTDALLDVIEYSASRHVHDFARFWAVKALCTIPRDDSAALNMIVMRTCRWLGTVSLDGDGWPSISQEHNESRLDQLKRRIGIDSLGRILVVGLEVEVVNQSLSLLKAAVPLIIEGFPLARSLPIFKAAAVDLAIEDQSKCWDGLKWLCLLNEVDPDETATALRDLSEEISLREPEPGVHQDLPKRIAALLLWLTGQEMDEDDAVSIEPGIDRPLTYEKAYLPQPGRSLFPLERRHAETVLNDTELPLFMRLRRTEELWIDPKFVPSETVIAELHAAAACIDVEKLDRNQGITPEDHHFEEIEPVLARYAPELLTDLIRRNMQSMATCPPESRHWSAIYAPGHLVLASEAESEAARTLRLRGCLKTLGGLCATVKAMVGAGQNHPYLGNMGAFTRFVRCFSARVQGAFRILRHLFKDKNEDENRELIMANYLLLMELRDLDVRNQFNELICADLKDILVNFEEILRPPTPDDVDALIGRYASGSPKQKRDLLFLLSIHPVKCTDNAWSWVEDFSKQEDDDLRRLAFKILNHADPVRFGRTLEADNWSWSRDQDIWINHYGTDALIKATSLSFEKLAPRLAPWRLLEAARRRGANSNEVRFAAEIFGHVLAGDRIETPDPGSNLSIDRTKTKTWPFSYSVTPRPSQEEEENFRLMLDADARVQTHQRAFGIATSRIRKARQSGADLYLIDFDAKDFEPVIQHAPDIVEQWLEGSTEATEEFQRRVHLAEGAFLALCEALLAHDPERGSQLWRFLHKTMITRYIGAAGLEDLLHMVFRVSDSPEVTVLREELIKLERCHTDQALFDLAIAAAYNGKPDWLATLIEQDQASEFVWRRKRAAVLTGFTVNNTLPVKGAWPDGEIKTGYAKLAQKSARYMWTEACARHWWQTYLASPNPTEAYAAWVLFLRSADRRCWAWMNQDIEAAQESDDFFKLKIAHAQLNQGKLKHALEKRENTLNGNFLNRQIFAGVGPWSEYVPS